MTRNVTAIICGDPPPYRSALVPESERYKSRIVIKDRVKLVPIERQAVQARLAVDRQWQPAIYAKIDTHSIRYTSIADGLRSNGFTTNSTTVSEAVRGIRGARPELMEAITKIVDEMIAEMEPDDTTYDSPARKYQRGPDRPYSAAETEMIVHMYKCGKDIKLIARAVNERFGNNRTRNSIRGKVSRMELKR